ncbi:MAG TPA: DNA methyltransferase [Pirellulales bacterium]|nr:DNA methyltransferase [Pirellulales bacterium]
MSNSIIRTYNSPNHLWSLHHGDILHVLPTLATCSFDGIVTDAPYGLKFMGQSWDGDVPPTAVWQELLRVCKPGAHLVAFGGTRTFHRLMVRIEDAGWEIRDTICWIYSQGFPKSQNMEKAIRKVGGDGAPWAGYGSSLKPAWEPIVLARKPFSESAARNAMSHGCGGLNIDGCRVGTTGGTKRSHQVPYSRSKDGGEDRTDWARTGHGVDDIGEGRWPANVILSDEAATELDRQSGHSRSRRRMQRTVRNNVGNGKTRGHYRLRFSGEVGYPDQGGASRFYSSFIYCPKAANEERQGNEHPTVKPLRLCEHLARLILQPKKATPRRLLVPFSGSGSEMIGGLLAGWDQVVGIEQDENYVGISKKRLSLGIADLRGDAPTARPSVRATVRTNSVVQGDCRDLISRLPDNSVDLVFTSPPYADQRKGHYQGVSERLYPLFTREWMAALWPKLSELGSVLIVIDPHVDQGVLADYVLRTRLALRESGWNEHQTQIWLKRDRGPLGRKDWPRHCYEEILWFSKSKKPFCDPKASGRATKYLTMNGYKYSRWTTGGKPGKVGIAKVTNVWDVPVGSNAKGNSHPAQFPVALPQAMIPTFCRPAGCVLDPFCGSGSSLVAAKMLGRSFVGFEIEEKYCQLATRRLAKTEKAPDLRAAG